MPTKYKKMFSDLSDVEIPWDMLFIGMELGEGKLQWTKVSKYGKLWLTLFSKKNYIFVSIITCW